MTNLIIVPRGMDVITRSTLGELMDELEHRYPVPDVTTGHVRHA